MIHGPHETQRRAADLRREMTLPEVLLWQELRKRPDGLKFRRQHPAGPYILDFFCAKLALAVEVDGIVHDCLEVAERDEVRDAWLSDNGVTVLRICARDILNDINSIIESITAQACDP
jgi:very-short-patch-repair endonuclease